METPESYKQKIKLRTPRSSLLKDSLLAFLGGGVICLLGEILAEIFMLFLSRDESYSFVTLILIFLAALLTGLGVFDDIARHLGAGTLVPVTGFANSVVSPALDTKSEGLIMGVGANIFKVAGPVILYATLSGMVYGIIYYIVSTFL